LSLSRAWWYLVWLSLCRQGRSLQTLTAIVLILLLAGAVVLVGAVNANMGRPSWNVGNFARDMVIGVYLTLLLPLVCLCFGTQALGGEWEERSLLWVLTRPIPRSLVYLAKFTAALPWALGCGLGGIWLAGLAVGSRFVDLQWNATLAAQQPSLGPLAGPAILPSLFNSAALSPERIWPGLEVVQHLWPSVALGSVAYLSLFVLLGALFRRSTVLGMAYAFLLEGLVGTMPGLLKRISLTFYTKCLAFDLADQHLWRTPEGTLGIEPPKTTLFLPVSGNLAWNVLVAISIGLLLLGTWRFGRKEFRDLTT
jgi:ABC-2 type transport system permease protein